MGLTSRQPRRLNRSQIQEILERNMQLYRNEENAATYLVELAFYLLEYEYDWADSPERAPASAREQLKAEGDQHVVAAPPARKNSTASTNFEEAWAAVTGNDTPVPQSPQRRVTAPAGSVAARQAATVNAADSKPAGDSRFISPDLRKMTTKYGTMTNRCPHCGTAIDRETLCPSCKNLVR